MDLFVDGPVMAEVPLGYRLERLEVYNWGTFDQRVWTFTTEGRTSLLTGEVGSGKSTLVDALLTLLVPPLHVTYNKAADASARERSLASYVLGYYGQRSVDGGSGRPEALRQKDSYSVILAVFRDRNLDLSVTLAQVFWFTEEGATSPRRLYVLAQKPLSITREFSDIGGDMRAFRKRLEHDSFIETFDEYPKYGARFRRLFGLREAKAMDLFQQTVSMKKVDSLTDFVRQNMLEEPEAEAEIEAMLRQYHDLEASHQAVQHAQQQQKLLEPIEGLAGEYEEARTRSAAVQGMKKMLLSWFADRDYRICEGQLRQAEDHLAGLEQLTAVTQRDLEQAQQRSIELAGELARHGGDQLLAARHQLEMLERELREKTERRQKYADTLSELGWKLPETAVAFAAARQAQQQRQTEARQETDGLIEDMAAFAGNRKELQDQARAMQEEITSLSRRRSNIPKVFVELRDQLAADLSLAAKEMPFAGELMAVRDDESEWEGALERLLRSFGISLLVPEAHYGEVADWMEHHHLALRLVYYRVQDDIGTVDWDSLPEDAACRKLQLREDSPYRDWIRGELARRFAHTCCENLADFRRARTALTRAGQVKINGRRHEKDDRHNLTDRRQYVLGFSNLRKIESLQEELENNKQEQAFFQKKQNEAKKRSQTLQQELLYLDRLAAVKEFTDIDTAPCEAAVRACRQRLAELESENDSYRQLKQEQQELESRLRQIEAKLKEQRSQQTQTSVRIQNLRDAMQEDLAVSSQHSEAERQEPYKLLDARAAEALAKAGGRYQREKRGWQTDLYSQYLDARQKEADERQQDLSRKLERQMQQYLSACPEVHDLVAEAGTAAEYIKRLDRIRRDDLPRFEGRFRELLHENTINQIALFYAHLDDSCREIEDRIGRINQSLHSIDYNEGRYINIECVRNPSRVITDFINELRACTSNTLSGSDEVYDEQRYQEVAELLQRLQGREGSTEADRRWRNEVTDVRNWYNFAATERWRDSDEEYEHYTDSGGKSGGQKEKLAYTILAASIVYNFGLEGRRVSEQSFRLVVIDEAFLKSSDESARFGLELFRSLDLQLLVVTPLVRIGTIEPFVSQVGFVCQDDETHRSSLHNMTIEELHEAAGGTLPVEKSE